MPRTDVEALDVLAVFLWEDPDQFPSGSTTCEVLDQELQATGRSPEQPKKAKKRVASPPTSARNANRAMVGQEAVRAASEEGQESEEAIVDALTNIGHWAKANAVDFDKACETAIRHVVNELSE